MTEGLRALLPADLPAGQLIGLTDDAPLYWLSEGPVDLELYRRLVVDHAPTGLWPVIAEALDHDVRLPWFDPSGLTPESVAAVDSHDPAGVLQAFWAEVVEDDEESAEALDPFGISFPGLAAPGAPTESPEDLAIWLATDEQPLPTSRLLLTKAARTADLLAVVGWNGPLNHSNEIAPLAAVLRSWEDRFGARVVKVGFDTLDVSVAAPPTSEAHALQVAAEHFAFCPDNIDQGAGSLREYAEAIQDANSWSFWWD
ncbi:DUF4253 domain-containing protein [Kribbella sp. NPDC051770]|uniref:DUF4253 domain-containing protein n=1 Tax=Kribbella sp. NPDC051770 TaxID=3155413 RepID=UPI00342073CB